MNDKELLTAVDGQAYLVQSAEDGKGLYFAPCTVIAGYAYYETWAVRYIAISEPVCLSQDKRLIQKLIGLHIRIRPLVETYNTASAN